MSGPALKEMSTEPGHRLSDLGTAGEIEHGDLETVTAKNTLRHTDIERSVAEILRDCLTDAQRVRSFRLLYMCSSDCARDNPERRAARHHRSHFLSPRRQFRRDGEEVLLKGRS